MSGILRVSIDHEVKPLRLILDGLIFAWVLWGEMSSWNKGSFFARFIMVVAASGALADLLYQLTGSEVVEFSQEGLAIRRSYFGWQHLREYPISKCRELSWLPDEDRKRECALECKVGWKRIHFGKYLSQTQAWDVLAELQRSLPAVAQKMGTSVSGGGLHITRLGIS